MLTHRALALSSQTALICEILSFQFILYSYRNSIISLPPPWGRGCLYIIFSLTQVTRRHIVLWARLQSTLQNLDNYQFVNPRVQTASPNELYMKQEQVSFPKEQKLSLTSSAMRLELGFMSGVLSLPPSPFFHLLKFCCEDITLGKYLVWQVPMATGDSA